MTRRACIRKRMLPLLLAAVWLFAALPLTACEPAAERFTEYSFDYFDTVTTVTGYAETEEEFKRVTTDILAELGEYHRLFTIYDRYEGMENLCTVNELVDGAHRVVKVDGRIMDLLVYAREMHERTDGRMNIAMGSVLSIWHDYREAGLGEPWNAELPPMEALAEAVEHTDIDAVDFLNGPLDLVSGSIGTQGIHTLVAGDREVHLHAFREALPTGTRHFQLFLKTRPARVKEERRAVLHLTDRHEHILDFETVAEVWRNFRIDVVER